MGMNDTKVMSLRLSEDLAAEMASICRVDEVTVSEGIRAAIYRHIAARRADKRFQAKLKRRLERNSKPLNDFRDDTFSRSVGLKIFPTSPQGLGLGLLRGNRLLTVTRLGPALPDL